MAATWNLKDRVVVHETRDRWTAAIGIGSVMRMDKKQKNSKDDVVAVFARKKTNHGTRQTGRRT